MERTAAYRFTITDRNDPRLAELKAEVKDRNQRWKGHRPCRVTIRARAGKDNPNRDKFRSRGSYAGPQNIPMDMGTRWDVYVHEYTPTPYSERKRREEENQKWRTFHRILEETGNEVKAKVEEMKSAGLDGRTIGMHLGSVLNRVIRNIQS